MTRQFIEGKLRHARNMKYISHDLLYNSESEKSKTVQLEE